MRGPGSPAHLLLVVAYLFAAGAISACTGRLDAGAGLHRPDLGGSGGKGTSSGGTTGLPMGSWR